MHLVLLGPPGCGKGTQASLLAQRRDLEHIATGDLLREAIRLKTPTGIRAQDFVESGRLVPDELVNDIVAERFHGSSCPARFVMDGYPRTLSQAFSFEKELSQCCLRLTRVLLLQVSDEEILRRLAGRRVCPNASCKASYHKDLHPPHQAGICDRCGAALVPRADDQPETVRSRLEIYHRDTAELVPNYRDRGLLWEALGEGGVEEVYERITAALPTEKG